MLAMVWENLVLLVFVLSILVVIFSISKGLNIAVALTLAFIIYSVLVLGPKTVESILATLSFDTLNTLLSLVFAMFLAELYKGLEVSNDVVKALESLSPRAASILVPMLLGLIPMPGGAYISATMVDPVHRSLGLAAEEKTFINFWFRHIWAATWPLYQAIILARAILNKSVSEIFSYTWIITIAMVLAGYIISYPLLKRRSYNERTTGDHRKLVHLWPFAVLAVLALATPLPLPVAVLVTIIFMVAVYRPSKQHLRKALIYALNPTFIALITVSLMFSNSIKISGLAEILVGKLSGLDILAVVLIPFSIMIATGVEFTFVALAFPAILPLLHGHNITLAFLGGVAGAMLSPSHACLVLSANYFKSPLKKVYRYTIPATVLTMIIVVIYTLIV